MKRLILILPLLILGCEEPQIAGGLLPKSQPPVASPAPDLVRASGDARGLADDTRAAAGQQSVVLANPAASPVRDLFAPLIARIVGNMDVLTGTVLPKIDVSAKAVDAMSAQYTALRGFYDTALAQNEAKDKELKAKDEIIAAKDKELERERESGLRSARIWLGIGAAALFAAGGALLFFGVTGGNRTMLAGGGTCLFLAGASVAFAIWLVEFALACGIVICVVIVGLGIWAGKALLDKIRQQREQVELQEVTKAELAKVAPASVEKIFGQGKEVLQHLSPDTIAVVNKIRPTIWKAPSRETDVAGSSVS